MKTAIIWFKTDLRLHDNETLVKAIAQNDQVIPVYCFDEQHFQNTTGGFRKTGDFRTKFICEAVMDLQENLRKKGSNLLIVVGKPEIELPKLAQAYNVHQVYAKKEVAYEEKATAYLVENALWKIKCELKTYSTSTLYNASDLPFSIRDIPDMFTSFRKKVEKESQIRAVFEAPIAIKSPTLPTTELPSLHQLNAQEVIQDERATLVFKGGETAAIQRLKHYFEESHAIASYKTTRNGLIGPDYSSKFSAWLALGCISPRYNYDQLKHYERTFTANESTYWLYFELLWRDYFRFMFKKHQTSFFLKNGFQDKPITTGSNLDLVEKWINGKTGQDFVDANMNELKLTGFMSNRGRQNVASYFCHDLKLDWRIGARYFEEQLIDYDVCSNWGNWAYLAGVGNDPRGTRAFNCEKQANDYDKNGAYRKLWLTKKPSR
jgi:deoxyribodipyrimidine photo-lyase